MTNIRKFARTTKFPLRFDRLHPGSLFVIHSEPSRNMPRSKDLTVYRRAYDNEGFYAYDITNRDRVAVLMPHDMVNPVREERQQNNKRG